jgi:hypothetical protein
VAGNVNKSGALLGENTGADYPLAGFPQCIKNWARLGVAYKLDWQCGTGHLAPVELPMRQEAVTCGWMLLEPRSLLYMSKRIVGDMITDIQESLASHETAQVERLGPPMTITYPTLDKSTNECRYKAGRRTRPHDFIPWSHLQDLPNHRTASVSAEHREDLRRTP